METPVIAVVNTCKSHALDAIDNREDGDKLVDLAYTLCGKAKWIHGTENDKHDFGLSLQLVTCGFQEFSLIRVFCDSTWVILGLWSVSFPDL